MKCYLMIRRIIALVVCAVQFILGLFGVSVNPMKNVIAEPNLAPQAIVADQSGSKIADAKFLTDGKVETYWSSGQQKGAYVELRFLEPVTFNTVVLRELTTSVKAFALQKYENGQWVDFFKSDRIETYRFCTFDPVTTQRVRLVVRGQVGTFRLQEMEIYNIAPKELDEPLRVAAYKRIDFNKTWKITDKVRQMKEAYGEDSAQYREAYQEMKTYSRYFEVINEVILFNGVDWTTDGIIHIRDGADDLRREIAALHEVFDARDIKTDVRITATILCPGNNEITAKSLEEHMDTLVENIVAFVKEFGLDGVDFDWEYPDQNAQWRLYGEFIKKLDKAFDRAFGDSVTIGVALANWGVGFSRSAMRAIDEVHVMAYDLFDDDGCHSTFMTGAYNPMRYFNGLQYPRELFNLGLPYYGRPTDGSAYWPSWSQVGNEPDAYWLNAFPGAYTDEAGNPVTIDDYYNSPSMIADKTAYAISLGIGGLMIFHMDCDLPMDHPNSLTLAIEKTLEQRVANYRAEAK